MYFGRVCSVVEIDVIEKGMLNVVGDCCRCVETKSTKVYHQRDIIYVKDIWTG